MQMRMLIRTCGQTVGAVLSFFLAMLRYPDVQAAAQAEIDDVTERARLPDFEDRERLPYVTALVWECLRWLPVLPMGRCAKEPRLTLSNECGRCPACR
jgi:cytochrome P450